MYRELTEQETEQLESQGCRCHEWTSIEVAEDFTPLHIRNTYFEGRIRIGADCRIANVGIIRSTPEATFGEGVTISVLNEAGDGNIILYSDLTAQYPCMVHHSDSSHLMAGSYTVCGWRTYTSGLRHTYVALSPDTPRHLRFLYYPWRS